MGIPQNIVHLLHGGNQDFPKLTEDLRLPVLSLGIQILSHPLKFSLHLDFVQEIHKHGDLIAQADRFSKSIFKPVQRLNKPYPAIIQRLQFR